MTEDRPAGAVPEAGAPRTGTRLARALRGLSRSHLRTALVAGLGAGGMAAYAFFVGCKSGSCPLTSSVATASLYGAVVGGLVGWPSRARDTGAGS